MSCCVLAQGVVGEENGKTSGLGSYTDLSYLSSNTNSHSSLTLTMSSSSSLSEPISAEIEHIDLMSMANHVVTRTGDSLTKKV